MEANNNYLVDFSKEYTYVASESLVQSAKGNNSDIYLNFAYTDYGGSFLDKVIISYFLERRSLYKEYYPENIVHEEASWNGYFWRYCKRVVRFYKKKVMCYTSMI